MVSISTSFVLLSSMTNLESMYVENGGRGREKTSSIYKGENPNRTQQLQMDQYQEINEVTYEIDPICITKKGRTGEVEEGHDENWGNHVQMFKAQRDAEATNWIIL